MRAALAAVVLCLAALPAGCGGAGGDGAATTPPTTATQPGAVAGTLDLERPMAGSPDAGTQGGHRPGAYRLEVPASTARFTGTVEPAGARVSVERPRGPVSAQAGALGAGRFAVTVRGLPRGVTRLTVRAGAPGRHPWRQDVRITRTSR